MVALKLQANLKKKIAESRAKIEKEDKKLLCPNGNLIWKNTGIYNKAPLKCSDCKQP